MFMNYRRYIFYITFVLNFFIKGEVFDGYTLFTPKNGEEEGASTHLINNDYEVINSWSHDYGPASMPYLIAGDEIGFENTLLIYPYRVDNPTMDKPKLSILNPDGSASGRSN